MRRKSSGLEGVPPSNRLRLTILLAFAATLVAMAFSAAPAFATEYSLKETFGSTNKPTFGDPAEMTVDPATGDLYVIDLENRTLSRWHANGTPDKFSALSSNVIDGHAGEADEILEPAFNGEEILATENLGAESEVAVAPPGAAHGTAGDIYVTNAIVGALDIFAPSGEYLATKKYSGYPCGVAVDPAGNVLVGDYVQGVHKMIPTEPGKFTESPNSPYPVSEPCQVAAGEGFVYASSFEGANHKIASEESETNEEGEEAYEVTESSSDGLAVDPANGHLFVAKTGGEAIEEFDVSGVSEASHLSTIPLVSAAVGVAVDGSTGDVYVTRAGHSQVEVFAPAPAGPKLTLNIEEGSGTVVSNPTGIECTGSSPHSCSTESIETGKTVTLTASPAAGYAFSSWSGCATHVGLTCTVSLTAAKTVKVKFLPTPSLSVEKTGTGQGKVSATGIACDENCSKAASAIKAGATVTFKVSSAKGSEAAIFESGTGSASGCSGATCTFTISANSSVKVKFNPIPTKTMTVNLTGPAAYKGKVSGKGIVKGLTGSAISCGAGCTTQTESFFATDTVKLTAVAGTGYTFGGWTGCDSKEVVEGKELCVVATSSNKTISAEFK